MVIMDAARGIMMSVAQSHTQHVSDATDTTGKSITALGSAACARVFRQCALPVVQELYISGRELITVIQEHGATGLPS